MRRDTTAVQKVVAAIAFFLTAAAATTLPLAFEVDAVFAAETNVGNQLPGEYRYHSPMHGDDVQTKAAGQDHGPSGFDSAFFPLSAKPLPRPLADDNQMPAPSEQPLHASPAERLGPDIFTFLLPVFVAMAVLGLWLMKKEIRRKTSHLLEENRERRQAEQALRRSEKRYRQAAEEIRSQNETENILSSLSALLLKETKLDEISNLVLETAKKLTTSGYGFVGSIDPDSGALISHTMTREIWKECSIADKKVVFKEYTGLWGWALTHRRPILVNDPANDPRATGTPAGHIAIDAFLGVPAIIGEEPAGMIALANPERPYTDSDMSVVLRLATIYAMALQRHHWEKALLAAEMEKSADLEKLVQTRTTELCQSREALRTLADFTYDWEIWLGPDGRLLYTSPSCERITGYGPEDFINNPLILVDIAHADDRARLAHHMHVEHAQPTVQKLDYRIINRDGELRWISHHCQPVYSKNGEYLGRRGSNRDITERKRNEERLAQSEARFRQLFNNLGSGVAIYDSFDDGATFVFKDLNPAGLALSGRSREDVIGRNVVDVFPGILELGLLDVFKRVWHSGLPEKLPARQYRDGDSVAWYDNYVCRLPTGELVAIFDDISHRKQAEDALAESQERLTLALDSVSDAVWDWRLDTGEVYFSSRYYTMLGYEPYEMEPSYATWVSLIHEEDLAAVDERIATHLASGHPFELEFRLRTKENQWKFILARGKTVEWDEQGKPLRMLGTHMDISERKRIEEQMQQVQKMEAIGTLAGGIAHDFNNILGAIIGHGELLQRFTSSGDVAVDRGLTQILQAAYRASDLVQQILSFSRKSTVQTIDLHIVPIVREVLKMIRASLPSTIDIDHALDIPDGTVLADATQMHQVLMNLCTNAGHAMREKGGTLTVRLKVESGRPKDRSDHGSTSNDCEHSLILEIGDTGVGIDKEILPQIFEPYFTTKSKGEGTGLGLSIVYGIIQNWGGTISVDSPAGGGTIFTVRLPFTPGSAEQGQSLHETISEGSGRVLFVDDEEVLIEYAHMLFTRIGYKVVTTSSSLEALAIFTSSPEEFDIIITDLTMPRMTGLELSREIRRISADIPIVLCSGNFDQDDLPAAKEAGITTFVAKPFRIKALAALMERLTAARAGLISA